MGASPRLDWKELQLREKASHKSCDERDEAACLEYVRMPTYWRIKV